MALPVTVLQLGPDDGDALVAEWYLADGAAVHKGEPVYRLETDFAAVEVEAEADGVLRHRAQAGTRQRMGEVIALIVAPGELLPGEEPAATPAPPLPKGRPRGDRRGAYPRAEVLRAAAEGVASSAPTEPDDPPWAAITSPDGDADAPQDQTPLLLFPRIVHELKEQAELEAVLGAELDSETTGLEMAESPEPPTRIRSSAWDLVPGENDFNPDWIMQHDDIEVDTPDRGRERFQASTIRSLALGLDEQPADHAREGAAVESAEQSPAPTGEPPRAPAKASPEPLVFVPVELPPVAVVPDSSPPMEAATPPRPRPPIELPSLERRTGYVPGPSLVMRVSVDVGEAAKMRDQLTREWWGSNIRPADEDIVLRAIARTLHESSAFRRRTDVVGMRPLAGSSRTVHLLSDAATRPFRDAVASLTALRQTPGADVPCSCTLTSYAELDLDEAMPALPYGQPLAFAMGAVRDVARYRGDKPYRAQVMVLTLSYDSDAMPDGAAARLLSRVRELVEAPYALLAD